MKRKLQNVLAAFALICAAPVAADEAPNVLFIAVDDLNDWIGCMGGHPQAKTPNMDALAARGTLFTNAHCQAPICGPSRASFLSGRFPHETGLYNQPGAKAAKMIDDKKNFGGQLITDYFAAHNYDTYGVGKITHGYPLDKTVAKAGPPGKSGPKPPNEKRFHYTPDYSQPYTGTQTDWGVYPDNEAEMPDFQTADWAINEIENRPNKVTKPFFMAVGFHRPHVPFYTPQKWFDMHPLDEIVLPEIRDDDLDDVPETSRQVHELPRYPRLPFLRANDNEQLRLCTQAYLACISFVDEQIGKVLDALDKSPHGENTIIVLFSDHGYHIGEKDRVSKHSLWEESTRVPLIIVDPRLQLQEGQVCDQPVGLIDMYPTLLDLCDLPPRTENSGLSLLPLLQGDNDVEWRHSIMTTYGRGNNSFRSLRHRYICYEDGSEELYDHENDPNEWTNIAYDPNHEIVRAKFRQQLPAVQAKYHPAVRKSAVNAWFEKHYKDQ